MAVLVKIFYSVRIIFVNTLRLSQIGVCVANGLFFSGKPLNYDYFSSQYPEVSSQVFTNKDVAFVAILVNLAIISRMISYLASNKSKIFYYELKHEKTSTVAYSEIKSLCFLIISEINYDRPQDSW